MGLHARDFVLAPRGLLIVDRAVVDQPTLAALQHRNRARAAPTFLKVYMELGSSFLFLQEQIKDIIIIVIISKKD